ncbi:MAG: orotidine 5'-phosphate decarboxylase / HUMPS family protein [Promethearchaeota archaeon]
MDLTKHKRYVQIAFNYTASQVMGILPRIPRDPRIFIEAGTPYIKREGIAGVRLMRRRWPGFIVADLKITDGAVQEVAFARAAGANAVTAMGSAPVETLDLFVKACMDGGLHSMIDMLGVENPLKKMIKLKYVPEFIVIHKGRDEENNPRSIIRYKDINKVRSKFGVFVSVAGGLDVEKVRSAYFNGADVAIINVIFNTRDGTCGLPQSSNITELIRKLLQEVGD